MVMIGRCARSGSPSKRHRVAMDLIQHLGHQVEQRCFAP
jgi:hypothetical protein